MGTKSNQCLESVEEEEEEKHEQKKQWETTEIDSLDDISQELQAEEGLIEFRKNVSHSILEETQMLLKPLIECSFSS
jgi:hypothetical protein